MSFTTAMTPRLPPTTAAARMAKTTFLGLDPWRTGAVKGADVMPVGQATEAVTVFEPCRGLRRPRPVDLSRSPRRELTPAA